jgi:hypothetical protein
LLFISLADFELIIQENHGFESFLRNIQLQNILSYVFTRKISLAFPKILGYPVFYLKKLCLETKLVSLIPILILSSHMRILISKHYFNIFCFSSFSDIPSSKSASSVLNAINYIQYPNCLDVTNYRRLICIRRFGINFHIYVKMQRYIINIVGLRISDH